jgi:hypothetical protein
MRVGLLFVLVLLNVLAQRAAGQTSDAVDISVQLSAPGPQLLLSGPQNSCFAVQASTDLAKWDTFALLNPTVWPTQATQTFTQSTVFFRSAVLGAWNVGGFSEALDLRGDFAAKGDGIADDTAAIQAALDSVAVHSNAVVFVSPGTYRLTRTCTLRTDSAVIQPRLILTGIDSTRTSFRWDGDAMGPLFEFFGCAAQLSGISIQTVSNQVPGIMFTASP